MHKIIDFNQIFHLIAFQATAIGIIYLFKICLVPERGHFDKSLLLIFLDCPCDYPKNNKNSRTTTNKLLKITTFDISFYCRDNKTDRNGFAPVEMSIIINMRQSTDFGA